MKKKCRGSPFALRWVTKGNRLALEGRGAEQVRGVRVVAPQKALGLVSSRTRSTRRAKREISLSHLGSTLAKLVELSFQRSVQFSVFRSNAALRRRRSCLDTHLARAQLLNRVRAGADGGLCACQVAGQVRVVRERIRESVILVSKPRVIQNK